MTKEGSKSKITLTPSGSLELLKSNCNLISKKVRQLGQDTVSPKYALEVCPHNQKSDQYVLLYKNFTDL